MIPLLASLLVIAGGTVIDAHGDQHRGLNVVCDGDKITAVTTSVPAGATTIDARGAWVSVGLFDAASRVGLAELGQDDVAHDTAGGDDGRPVAAGLRVVDGFDPNNTAIPVTRVEGVTMAALAPGGGLLAGQGAVVELGGAGGPHPVLRTVGQFGSLSVDDAHIPGGSRSRVFGALREVLTYGRMGLPITERLPFSMGMLDYRAVQALSAGKTRFLVGVHRASDIVATLQLAREQHLPVALLGAEEGWMVAKQIAAAKVPVVLDPFADLPASMETRGSRLDNAALLHQAGVEVAIGTWSDSNARNLRQAAGIAVANGLPWAAAWRAVTTAPAGIYGLTARYGDVAPGMAANLVVWGGDPFEPATDVRAVVIGGRAMPLETRQDLLARKYRKLP